MSKLIFNYKRYYDSNIVLIANNHIELHEYLTNNFNFFSVVVGDECVKIVEEKGYETEFISLIWAKEI